jgi:hypothetical protein
MHVVQRIRVAAMLSAATACCAQEKAYSWPFVGFRLFMDWIQVFLLIVRDEVNMVNVNVNVVCIVWWEVVSRH